MPTEKLRGGGHDGGGSERTEVPMDGYLYRHSRPVYSWGWIPVPVGISRVPLSLSSASPSRSLLQAAPPSPSLISSVLSPFHHVPFVATPSTAPVSFCLCSSAPSVRSVLLVACLGTDLKQLHRPPSVHRVFLGEDLYMNDAKFLSGILTST
ncbi:hypothetical protein PIB30_056902 [Stylosanthes scabra]|uniref:Uncharacterized protein n=1 Tax=Stylosanthes scabra TaxID=79078 RepID=A0ABU6YHN7_9FABA|nr:hypothetical protein [Stylosanthes scabra]